MNTLQIAQAAPIMIAIALWVICCSGIHSWYGIMRMSDKFFDRAIITILISICICISAGYTYTIYQCWGFRC